MSDGEGDLTAQLKAKPICRFCLGQDVPLSNIYSAENRKIARVPLPLLIMSSISIEVGKFITIVFCHLPKFWPFSAFHFVPTKR